MRHYLYIAALLFIGTSSSFAQQLTWEQCRQMALEHNKDVQSAKTQAKQTETDIQTYKSNFYPRLNLIAADMYSTGSGSFTMQGGHLPIYHFNSTAGTFVPNVTPQADGSYTLNEYADFPDQKLDLKVKNVFLGAVTFTQPIYTGGKITTAYEMSQIGNQMADLNVQLTEEEVLVQTKEAYILTIKAQEMTTVAESYKSLLEELYKNVESAFRHGLKTRNDMMKVQVKLNEVELNITKAKNAHSLAIMNLCHYIGLPLDSKIDVVPMEKKNVNTEAYPDLYIPTNVNARKEYSLLEKKAQIAEKQVKLARSEYMPNVVLIGGYSYTNGLELAGKKLFNDGAASIAIGVKMPLYTFGESSSKIKSAKAKYELALLEKENFSEKMMLEQQQAYNRLREAQKELDLTTLSLQQAQENMRLSKQQYEVGFETLSDYLEAQAIWQTAYSNKVNAQCELELMQLKYNKAMGDLDVLNQ